MASSDGIQNRDKKRTFLQRLQQERSSELKSSKSGRPSGNHPLAGISQEEFESVKDFSVVISGFSSDGSASADQTMLHCGNSVKRLKNMLSERCVLDMEKLQGKKLLILCPISCVRAFDEIDVTPCSASTNMEGVKYAVLLLAKALSKCSCVLPDNVGELLKQAKPSAVKPGAHFDSAGNYYAFGLKADFGKLKGDICSLGTYATKEKGRKKMVHLQDIAVGFVEDSRKELNEIVRGVCAKAAINLSSIGHAASRSHPKLKGKQLVDQFSRRLRTKAGDSCDFTSIIYNEDAVTNIPHRECDCSDTFIGVPILPEKMKSCDTRFNFVFSHGCLEIKLKPKVAFLFSAFLLKHNQIKYRGSGFVNISAYGNKRLLCNARKTLQRLQDH